MTAEIAILNKSGVALAADSKVTVGGGRKTFDTVNKIFSLSKVHPIGIMVYGNAEFMRYPWEIIVKLYRSEKGDRAEDTVEKWGKDFVRFLKKFGNIRPEDKEQNIELLLYAWFDSLLQSAMLEARDAGIQVASDPFTDILRKLLSRQLDIADKRPSLLTASRVKSLNAEYASVVPKMVNLMLGGFKAPDVIDIATKFAWLALSRNCFSPISSGVVFAGYGEKEYFPTVVQYDIDGYVGDVIKLAQQKNRDISRDLGSAIMPFAQKEMVQRFMDGVDPAYSRFERYSSVTLLVENCLAVLDKYGRKAVQTDAVRTKIKVAVMKSFADNAKQTRAYQKRKFSDPIVEMVTLLPKEELPHLAESLVALTSLKRRVSNEVETVGGPIDVCLISKGDGFVWIKRKHYFRPELNIQFESNYMRDVTAGGEHHVRKPAAKR